MDDQIEDGSIHSMSHARGLPTLHPLPQSSPEEASELYKSPHPPILQNAPWTLAVPYKEQRHFRTPSESIGNNYSPHARHLKIRHLYWRHGGSAQGLPRDKLASFPRMSSYWEKRQKLTPRTRDLLPQSFKHSPEHKLSGMSSLAPSSRPLTPNQQLDIICWNEQQRSNGEPSPKDLERYLYYVTNGVPSHMLAAQPPQQVENIRKLLTDSLKNSTLDLLKLESQLLEEVQFDYDFSLRKSIVDYILKDPSERQRLVISTIPHPFPRRIIRGPVPWASSYIEARSWQAQHLFTVNPIMFHLQDLWLNGFSSLRFVSLSDLLSANLPLLPVELEALIQRQCQVTRNHLLNKWLPRGVSLFTTCKELWLPLVHSDKVAPVITQEFFSSVATLMSLQLRSLVMASLQDLLHFLMLHQACHQAVI